MSIEQVRLINESQSLLHHENPNDEEDHDNANIDDDIDNNIDNSTDNNSGNSGDDFLGGPSPEHLDTGFPNRPRLLTYVNGLAILIGLQVGAGIFSVPAVVRTNVSTSTMALSIWVLAGFLVWMGATGFIELGTRIPLNGGMQEYLRRCYGDVYGFLFAWTWIFLSRPCATAMVSLVFSEYLFKTLSPDHDVDAWVLKGTALLAVMGITLLNFMGTGVGAGVSNFFLVLKVFAISTVAVAGLVFAVGDLTRAQPQPVSPPATLDSDSGNSSLWANVGGFADAILATLFAYGGSESLGFVVGEMKDPGRTLPRVIHSTMALTITLFFLANFAFYYKLSKEELQKTNAVAIAFGRKILGEPGAWFYALMVCLCALGSLNAIIFSAGRLTQAAGTRNYLPAFLGAADSAVGGCRNCQGQKSTCSLCAKRCTYQSWRKGQNIPVKAMLLNAAITAGYVLVGSFRGLVSFKGMIVLSVYIATIGGTFVLRSRPAGPDRGSAGTHYQAPTINLVIFCSIGTLIVIRSAIIHVFQALTVVVLLGAGSIIYRSTWWRTIAGQL